MEKDKKTLYGLITTAIVTFLLIQIHEYQHYKDFKKLNCTNIKHQVFRVKAYCPDLKKAQELSEYRDRQFMNLWLN
ncbi:MAG: hypothetical protein KC589_08935 [Nanoarchaeota archaeon]|nr:hypothetical protein [Nanoarchaeota archaeon]MCA9497045.1 hypothetical protein [Nanoarchaeota archaeon]